MAPPARPWRAGWLVLLGQRSLAKDTCAGLDAFEERLHLEALPSTNSPQLFFARFEFDIQAPLSPAFFAGQFDIFPRAMGKLLGQHRALDSVEAALTRGRWREEWGPAHEPRPPGALLVAGAAGAAAAHSAWGPLASSLAGSLCASFGALEPLAVPWRPGLLFAALPQEPLCTENLTPWLKLLPCGRHRGLAALLAPVTVAESPLVSMRLVLTRSGQGARLHASLDAVLPLGRGPGAWFGGPFVPCSTGPSTVLLRSGAVTRSLAPEALAGLGPEPAAIAPAAGAPAYAAQAAAVPAAAAAEASATHMARVSVMRDVLSHEGRSERTHGRYLLRLSNPGHARIVRLLDRLPPYLRPLWHTLRLRLEAPGRPPEELSGVAAARRLQLQVAAAQSTELVLALQLPPAGVASVSLDVLKAFVQLRGFSYACEKGFDVGSAAWAEEGTEAAGPAESEQLRFTQGLLVLLPMPDFSMPFNVIALSSTAVTFFFGSVFRLTAAGRVPHWALRREGPRSRARFALLALAGGLLMLHHADGGWLRQARARAPAAGPLLDLLEALKEALEKAGR
mmetsp:Transcript_10595/g.31114  ORF Transcript_10595/g.31114 Transcript_10595/m.31114 type:complete len:565 (-) Transcript_10595:167-1861(-)